MDIDKVKEDAFGHGFAFGKYTHFADASRLRDGLGACDLERTGVGAGAQQGNRGGGRSHQAG